MNDERPRVRRCDKPQVVRPGYLHFGAERQMCEMCLRAQPAFEPTPDTAKWNTHRLADPSWQEWRDDNLDEVARLRALVLGPVP